MGECLDTVAFVLIKTEFGAAADVAEEVSNMNWTEEGQTATKHMGVRWASIVTGQYDVIAAVRVANNEKLADLVINQIQKVNGIRNPTTTVSGGWYVNGDKRVNVDNGYP
jgi:DNA-binding Lrp family transcriptional regulator